MRKYNKAQLVDAITDLRKIGLTAREIASLMKLSREYVAEISSQFKLPWVSRKAMVERMFKERGADLLYTKYGMEVVAEKAGE